MDRSCGINNLPIVLIEDLALLVGQGSIRIIYDGARLQRNEGRIYVYGVGVTRKIYRVNSVIREVSLQPLHTASVGC